MMKQNMVFRNYIFLLTSVALASLGFYSLVFSQESDLEPNNTCDTAQEMGSVSLPFTLSGSLDTPPTIPDIDFFQFTGNPGELVQVDLEGVATGKGTLSDPFLGLFASDCSFISYNDDTSTLNSRLAFPIPDDGIYVLAATSCCDSDFIGVGGSSGTYSLTISPFLAIGSISGQLQDAKNGMLVNGETIFSYIELIHCFDDLCESGEFISSLAPDSQGHFYFDQNYIGSPLGIGTYLLFAYADQYQGSQTLPFNVGEGEDFVIDILLTPNPIQFTGILSCDNIPTTGGQCIYSTVVSNRMDKTIRGAAWSIVYSGGLGTFVDYSTFQTGNPLLVNLKSEETKEVSFNFNVPNRVKDGAYFCSEAWFGDGRSPYTTTLGQRFLFCIYKESGGVRVLPMLEARELMKQTRSEQLFPHAAVNLEDKDK